MSCTENLNEAYNLLLIELKCSEEEKNETMEDGRNETYPVWKSDTAQHIRPIQDQQGTDPLDAFLKYFAK